MPTRRGGAVGLDSRGLATAVRADEREPEGKQRRASSCAAHHAAGRFGGVRSSGSRWRIVSATFDHPLVHVVDPAGCRWDRATGRRCGSLARAKAESLPSPLAASTRPSAMGLRVYPAVGSVRHGRLDVGCPVRLVILPCSRPTLTLPAPALPPSQCRPRPRCPDVFARPARISLSASRPAGLASETTI